MHAHDLEALTQSATTSTRRPHDNAAAATLAPASVLGAGGLAKLQREVGNEAVTSLVQQRSPVLDVVGKGGGSPLDTGLRRDMESRLGADFGDVRVHTDSAAHESARSVGAHAYTVGRDVVFQRDAFDPGSHAGRTTIAHELTHVIQQRSGPVSGTANGSGVKVSDPGDSFEQAAAANADRVMAAPVQTLAEDAHIQRHAEDSHTWNSPRRQSNAKRRELGEQEEVQGLFVQREESLEEEAEGA